MEEKKAALTADGMLHKVYEHLLHRSLASCKKRTKTASYYAIHDILAKGIRTEA